jgi:uncharacterized protein YdeI (YjbR/CyaY-like superfamily)
VSPARGPGPADGEVPIRLFRTTGEWERWLARHADSPGVWMRIARKGAALRSIGYAEALDVALRHGWIDSQKKRGDDESFLQKFTPRGARSVWSRVNREKVERFIADGAMKPAGLRRVEQARANGQWDRAYDSHSRATVPPDLEAALARNRKARAFFATLNSTNRYAILWRLQTAVRPETRERRLKDFVAMLTRGETLHPPSARAARGTRKG